MGGPDCQSWRIIKIMGFGENTSLKQICFFLHISVRGKWFWIDETGTRCIDFGRNVAYVEATAAAVKTLNMDSAYTSVKNSVEQEPEKKWKGPFRFFMVVDLLLICLLVCLVSLFSWLVRCFPWLVSVSRCFLYRFIDAFLA